MRDCVRSKLIDPRYRETSDMVADELTKNLPAKGVEKMRKSINLERVR